MTANAQHGRVEFGRLDRSRILDMFLQCSVARFAVDVRMPAALFLFQDVRMAIFASLVAGEVHRTSGDFGEGISAVVSVLSETLRHQQCTHSHQRQAADQKNRGQSKEVSGIFEGSIHKNVLI